MRTQGGLFPVLSVALPLLAVLATAGPGHAADKKVAVFDFELIDTSLEGELKGANPGETERLETMAPQLRGIIKGEPTLSVVDTASVEAKVKDRPLSQCDTCAVELGKELGADIVISGTVQKVSNLILNINAYGHDVATGKLVAQGSADIRGNNDEMWTRGLNALWKNTLKKQFLVVEAGQ